MAANSDNGTTDLNPVPATVPGLSNVVAVSAGSEFALALLGDGSIMAWGENHYGQLGLDPAGPELCNSVECSRIPRQVPGVANAIAISAYGYHSMALLADGTVLSWGWTSRASRATASARRRAATACRPRTR